MKYLLFLVMILYIWASSACGRVDYEDYPDFRQTKREHVDKRIDPELAPYLTEYLSEVDKYGKLNHGDADKIWRFEYGSDFEGNLIGLCELSADYDDNGKLIEDYRYVTISTKLKDLPIRLKHVIFHELSHCVFRVDHSRDPSNIMYQYVHLSDLWTESNWTTMVKEMFDFISLVLAE